MMQHTSHHLKILSQERVSGWNKKTRRPNPVCPQCKKSTYALKQQLAKLPCKPMPSIQPQSSTRPQPQQPDRGMRKSPHLRAPGKERAGACSGSSCGFGVDAAGGKVNRGPPYPTPLLDPQSHTTTHTKWKVTDAAQVAACLDGPSRHISQAEVFLGHLSTQHIQKGHDSSKKRS